MSRVTVSATDVVAPVFAAAEVVVLLFAGVAAQTRFGDLFRRFVLEGDDLLWVAFFGVRLAWSMTRLATGYLVVPTADLDELSVRRMRERFELIFMAILASLTAHIVLRLVGRNFTLTLFSRVRRAVGSEPTNASYQEAAKH